LKRFVTNNFSDPTLRAKARKGWGTQIFRVGGKVSGRAARVALSLLIAAVVCLSLGATDPQAHFEKLGNGLMCTCGCEQQLLKCDHVGCTFRGEEMDMLKNGIASGQNDSLILQSFVQRYGATVLSAPTTEGFDLLAWIMPFAVAAAALIGTILLVRNWAKNQATLASATAPLAPAEAKAEESMRERIRRETGTE
jgi:cytochrome c-type biogenesis protein CcmH